MLYSTSLVYGRWFRVFGGIICIAIPQLVGALVSILWIACNIYHFGLLGTNIIYLIFVPVIIFPVTLLFQTVAATKLYISLKETRSTDEKISKNAKKWFIALSILGVIAIVGLVSFIILNPINSRNIGSPSYIIDSYMESLTPADMVRKEYSQNGFAITVPKDWEEDIFPDGSSWFYIAPEKLFIGGPVRVSVAVTKFLSVSSLDEGIVKYIEGNSPLSGFKLISQSRTVLNGIPAVKFIVERERYLNGVLFVQTLEEYMVIKNGLSFLVSQKNSKQFFPYTKELTDKIVKTFEIL